MEDPGFWLHRMVLGHNGIDTAAVPVDGDGLDVAALAASGAATVLATPAHQSPTGVVLTAARRTALLDWARADNLIIEDDYDAEYRYDRAPVGALQGVAPDRVVYLGSTSKTLAPGLRLGWMVLPAELVGPVTLAKGLADTGSSVMDQIAFAQLLTSGGYDRHLRQMRRRYLTRRNALLRALSRYLPQATVLGAAAGVHLTVRFPPGYPIDELVAGRRAAGQGRAAGAVLRRSSRRPAGSDARLCEPHRIADPGGCAGSRQPVTQYHRFVTCGVCVTLTGSAVPGVRQDDRTDGCRRRAGPAPLSPSPRPAHRPADTARRRWRRGH